MIDLEAVEARVAARRALPCSECSEDVECACCGVDREFVEVLGVVRTVAELADDLAASPAVGGSSAEQWEFDTRRQVATEIRAALAALTGTTEETR